MPNLNELLSEVIDPLGANEVEPIYSYVEEVRKGAIRAITERFPEAVRPEAKQGVPIKFLESRTYEGVLAAASWLTELILEGKVDHEVIESVYSGLYLEYIHLNAGEEEQNKKDARDVKERMGKIVVILKQNKDPEKTSPSNNFIDVLEARFEFDFHENFERSREILEPMAASEYEGAVGLLGNVYEAQGKYREAKELYKKWAEKTKKTTYYKALIIVLWKLSQHEAANQCYTDYMILAGAYKEEPVPYIVLKQSIDTDDDLSEMGAILTALFGEKSFDAEYIPLLSKAREYVDRGLKKCLSSLNALGLAISDQGNTFSTKYVNPHFYTVGSKNLFAPEYHHIWIRLLFLYAINALVLFDNTPLRKYELFSKDGDEVVPKSVREKGESIVVEFAEENTEPANEKKPIDNPGKVEEFLEFLIELNNSLEGSLILTDFFNRYPFRSISRIVDGLEEQYEKAATTKANATRPDTGKKADDTKKEDGTETSGDSLIPYSSHLKHSDLAIVVDYGEDREDREDEEMGITPKTDDDDDEAHIGALPGKIETPKTVPLEDILFFINSVYISPEDRGIQERAYTLYEKYSDESGAPSEKSGREFHRIDTLEKSLLLAGEGMIEEYERVGKIIEDRYGPTIKKAILFYASESVILQDETPEFLLNDYYLAWYLLVSHLLCANEIDDDLVKDLMEQSVFYIDYLEGVDDLNSMIISCLVFAGLYDLACDFMIRTRMVTNPPTFSLFLSCLSYLDEDMQMSFLEEIKMEVFPEYEGVTDVLELITAIEGDIDDGDEFESDDRIRCDLARAYYHYISKDFDAASEVLSKIDEKITESVPDMVVAEIEFLRIRLHIEEDLKNGKLELLPTLENLYERLDFEYKTECMYYMLRLSFRKETETKFKSYLDRAIEDKLQVGLWKYSYGVLSDNEETQRESLAAFATSDLTFIPKEVEKKLIDKCFTWKYNMKEPISDFGDMKLQAAYVLSHFAIGTSTALDSIYQYSIWLHHYLMPKNGQYTSENLEELIQIFEDSFGYVETAPIQEQNLSRKFSHFIIRHYYYFSEEFTKIQKLHKKNNPKIPFPIDQQLLWKKATRNFIEILQRFQNDEIEPFIGVIRDSYQMRGGDFAEEAELNVEIQSQLIH